MSLPTHALGVVSASFAFGNGVYKKAADCLMAELGSATGTMPCLIEESSHGFKALMLSEKLEH